ncbi:hypothetical protein PS639_00069 [Pseudomonas fluorescens]|nr:LacI family transcriptional regulator [Pseudomonas fluorescens]VVM36531.1 hypothetical protein PS639_00069 [Pseudomonas fluorescens]
MFGSPSAPNAVLSVGGIGKTYAQPVLAGIDPDTLVGELGELGEMAAEVLLRRIATPAMAIDQRIVTPSIVLRESTAPLAGVFAQCC